jgi:hypothetical protein
MRKVGQFRTGEVRHHPDCYWYAASFSQCFDKLESENKQLRAAMDSVRPTAGLREAAKRALHWWNMTAPPRPNGTRFLLT